MKYESKVIGQWIQDCLESGQGITKWEADFLVSIEDQLKKKGSLSDKQVEILERIYTEKVP